MLESPNSTSLAATLSLWDFARRESLSFTAVKCRLVVSHLVGASGSPVGMLSRYCSNSRSNSVRRKTPFFLIRALKHWLSHYGKSTRMLNLKCGYVQMHLHRSGGLELGTL